MRNITEGNKKGVAGWAVLATIAIGALLAASGCADTYTSYPGYGPGYYAASYRNDPYGYGPYYGPYAYRPIGYGYPAYSIAPYDPYRYGGYGYGYGPGVSLSVSGNRGYYASRYGQDYYRRGERRRQNRLRHQNADRVDRSLPQRDNSENQR